MNHLTAAAADAVALTAKRRPTPRRRALVIAPIPTWPLTAGNRVRAWQTAQALRRRGYEIHLIYFDQETNIGGTQYREMAAQWDSLHVVPYRPELRRRIKEQEIWRADDWFQDDLGVLLARLVGALKPDLLWFNYFWGTKALEYLPWSVSTIVDTHDRMGDRHLLLDQLGIKRGFFYCEPAEEKRALARADYVIAIQEQERQYFEGLGLSTVRSLGFLGQVGRRCRAGPRAEPVTIGYIASSNHLNRKFLGEFISSVPSAEPVPFRLLVAGQIGRSMPADLMRQPWIIDHGPVEHVSEFYERVDLTVNPMFEGTGLKMKTLESLDWGVPVVGGPAAFEGLDGITFGKCRTPASMLGTLHALTQPGNFAALVAQQQKAFAHYVLEQESRFDHLLAEVESGPPRWKHTRMLVVTDVDFWTSRYGSNSRIREVVRALSRTGNLTVFVFRTVTDGAIADLRKQGIHCEVVSYKRYEQSSNHRALGPTARLKGTKPISTWYDAFHRFIAEQPQFDACLIEYHHLAYVIDALPNRTMRILDTHDLKSSRTEELQRVGLPVPDEIAREDELKLLRQFDMTFMISEEEHNFARISGLNSVYVPFLVEVHPNARTALEHWTGKGIRALQHPSLLLIGSAAAPNLLGFRWFLTYAWPALAARGLRLKIIGNAGPELRSSHPDLCRDVDILGYVDRLPDHVAAGDILVNPVHVGSGQKTKIMDAAALGTVVVTAPEGLNGLPRAVETGWMVATDAADFVDACIHLADSPDARCRAVQRSIAWLDDMASKYATESIMGQVLARCAAFARR